VKQYYDARAPEYDEWYLGLGKFAARDRPGWHEALHALQAAIQRLPPKATLDVACGTGFLTRHLPGEITGLDQSERMLAIASRRVPHATFVHADALELPFEDDGFERVFTAHFYGHLRAREQARFIAEAHRIAPELVIVDSAARPDHASEEYQQRVLNDGSSYEVFKRYFEPSALAGELPNPTVIHGSSWFVVVASSR
jgi:ubiquinone/menaquinone biosynthesis C-methylase UbiE